MNNLSRAEFEQLLIQHGAGVCPPARAWMDEHPDLDLRGLVEQCPSVMWLDFAVWRLCRVLFNDTPAVLPDMEEAAERVQCEVDAYHRSHLSGLTHGERNRKYTERIRDILLPVITEDYGGRQ